MENVYSQRAPSYSGVLINRFRAIKWKMHLINNRKNLLKVIYWYLRMSSHVFFLALSCEITEEITATFCNKVVG